MHRPIACKYDRRILARKPARHDMSHVSKGNVEEMLPEVYLISAGMETVGSNSQSC